MKTMSKADTARFNKLTKILCAMGAREHEAAVELRTEYDALCDKKSAATMGQGW